MGQSQESNGCASCARWIHTSVERSVFLPVSASAAPILTTYFNLHDGVHTLDTPSSSHRLHFLSGTRSRQTQSSPRPLAACRVTFACSPSPSTLLLDFTKGLLCWKCF